MSPNPGPFADSMGPRVALAFEESLNHVQGVEVPQSQHAYRYLDGMPICTQRALGSL